MLSKELVKEILRLVNSFLKKKLLHIPFKNANVVPPLWMSSPNYEGALSICCLTLLHFSRINPSHYYLAVLCYTYRFSLSCPPFWYSDCGCRWRRSEGRSDRGRLRHWHYIPVSSGTRRSQTDPPLALTEEASSQTHLYSLCLLL